MDQYNNQPKNNELQEIDLVDLAVVIWRRKIVIVGATVLGMALAIYIITTQTRTLNVSAVFFVGQAAVITEEVSLAEALAGKKEGLIATELLMELGQSRTLLGSIYLPHAISKQLTNTEVEYLKFESNISIEIGDGDSKDTSQMSSKVIRLSATTTEEFVSDYKAIIDNALTDLADIHNQVYERHQDLTRRQIKSKTHELKAHLDSRAIASGKQPLISRQLTNQINQSEHKDEELNKRIDLRLQLAILNAENAIKGFNYHRPTKSAERQIARADAINLRNNNTANWKIARAEASNLRNNNTANRQIARAEASNLKINIATKRTFEKTTTDIERANISLARLDGLVEHNSDLRLKLVSELSDAEIDRRNLRSRLASKSNTSTLITEAINVIDSRVARYETKISDIDQQLHVDLPPNRLLIKSNIELLNRKLADQEEDHALELQKQDFDMSVLQVDHALELQKQDFDMSVLQVIHALELQKQDFDMTVLQEDFVITKQVQDTNLINLQNTLEAVIHDDRVSKLNRAYTQAKLDNEKAAIETALLGHDASFEAKTLRLNSDIDGLNVVLEQSIPSEILASATARPEKSRSAILIGMVIVMFFGAIGFFFAFVFELLDKAKTRIAESN